jgi:hypothetical protein
MWSSTLRLEPNVMKPYMLMLEPMRTNDLIEATLPSEAKSKTESEDPSRPMP